MNILDKLFRPTEPNEKEKIHKQVVKRNLEVTEKAQETKNRFNKSLLDLNDLLKKEIKTEQ